MSVLIVAVATILCSFYKSYKVSSITLCNSLLVKGIGDDANGPYLSINDYRGRPDFYSVGGNFNLFGEQTGDAESECTWRIDNVDSQFPYYISMDCAYHPVDIESQWFEVGRGLVETEIYPSFDCNDENDGGWENTKKIIIIVLVCVVSILIFIGHAYARRVRIRNWKYKCPSCQHRVEGASGVIRASFAR